MLNRLFNKFSDKLVRQLKAEDRALMRGTDGCAQTALMLQYRQLLQSGAPLPTFREVGWKAYSQTDEDGIIHFLFSILGTTNKKSVEICAGDATECNTINLILHRGWTGLLVDGNAGNVERGKQWLSKHPNTYVSPPVFACEWITKHNVNDLLEKNGFAGEIDLLSIDIDGVDYWLWKAITVANPRVVVIEYQQHLGPERSWTIPYSDDFNAWQHPVTGWLPNYAGASLRALNKLAAEKGYRLVGTNNYCFNAFFVRNDLGQDLIPAVPVENCFDHPRAQWSMQNRFQTVAHLPWVEV
jgi:hypothetical protein